MQGSLAAAGSTPTFPVLDTLRAVGALAVLTTHVAFWAGDYTRHGALGTLFARLDVGVALFFVISGFLLSYPYLARAQAGLPAPRTRRYLWKRFLRIYPVYALTVVLAMLLIRANAGASFWDWVSTLLLADVYVHPQLPYGLTQMWSLAVEVAFYLTLPAIARLAVGREQVLRPRRVVLVLVALSVGSLAWHLVWGSGTTAGVAGSPLLWLPAFLGWFALGTGLALVHLLHGSGAAAGRLGRGLVTLAGQPGSCWALAGGLLLLAATPLAGPSMLAAPSTSQSVTKYLLYAVIGGLLVLPGVLGSQDGMFARAFSVRAARHLGVISYGIFCLHLPALSLVMWLTGFPLFRGNGVQIWLLTVLISVAAAELVYRLVERRAMRLKDLGRRTPSMAVTTAPVSDTSTR